MKFFLIALMALCSLNSWAHGDDEHADETPVANNPAASPRLELTSEQFEVLVVLKEQRLQLYVDDWASNTPVDQATITVQWQAQSLDAVRIAEGVYRTGEVPLSGDNPIALVISIQTETNADLLNAQWQLAQATEAHRDWHLPSWWPQVLVAALALAIGWWWGRKRALTLSLIALLLPLPPPVDAHGDDTHGEEEPIQSKLLQADEKALRLSDGSLFVPKPVQRLLTVRTQLADFSASAFNAKLPAEVQYDPQQGSVVQAPVPGRISAIKNFWPAPGKAVKKGQPLLQLQWQLSATETAQLQAQLARIKAQLNVAEARWQRVQHLTESLPRKDLEQAQADVIGLRAERDALQNGLAAPQIIRADRAGIISQVNISNGQQVEASTALLSIYSGQLTVAAFAPSDFQVMAKPQATFVSGPRRIALEWIGQANELRDQQRPLWFRIKDNRLNFAVGDSGQVLIETATQQNGVKVPAQAIVRADDGSKAVLIKRSAENFRLQTVHVQNLSNGEVLLLSGIRAGERIVIEGAPLLAQLR